MVLRRHRPARHTNRVPRKHNLQNHTFHRQRFQEDKERVREILHCRAVSLDPDRARERLRAVSTTSFGPSDNIRLPPRQMNKGKKDVNRTRFPLLSRGAWREEVSTSRPHRPNLRVWETSALRTSR